MTAEMKRLLLASAAELRKTSGAKPAAK